MIPSSAMGRATRGRWLAGWMALVAVRAEAQQTGGSFGGSRGFGSRAGGGPSAVAPGSSTGGGGSTGFGQGGTSSNERTQRAAPSTTPTAHVGSVAAPVREPPRPREIDPALLVERALPVELRARSPRFGSQALTLPPQVWPPPTPAATRLPSQVWWSRDVGDYTRSLSRPQETYVSGWTGVGVLLLAGTALMARRLLRSSAASGPPSDEPEVPDAPRAAWVAPVAAVSAPTATLKTVTVAVDGRRRRALQSTLKALGATHDLSTPEGMERCQRAIAEAVKAAPATVRYARVEHQPVAESEAQRRFESTVTALRGRYVVETVRGAMQTRGPAAVARAEEGEGFVVLSLVAGYEGTMAGAGRDASAWSEALDALSPREVSRWVALEVVWSPTDEDDRMSSAELETLYPELTRLDDGVGRMVCASCKAVGAKELGECPSCGAPYAGQ